MAISIVKKAFKLDDQIIFDDGTIVSIQKVKGKSGFRLIIQRDSEIGKITVVKQPHTKEEINGNTWTSNCDRH